MTKILLIEDNLDIRENTTELLELAGYHVLTAVDGGEGISKALAHLPDVILCDIQMPVKSGYEVFSELRANPKTSQIPFIFVTASAEKREVQAALSSGANGYLCKPFEPNELHDVILTVMGQSIKNH